MKGFGCSLPALAILLLACSTSEEGIRAEYRPLTEAVYASGVLEPANRYELYAKAPGILLKKYVETGDTVARGQLLFELDNGQEKARTAQAEVLYKTSQKNYGLHSSVIAQLRAELKLAAEKLRQDSLNYARYTALHAENVVPAAQLENAALGYESSLRNLQALQAKLQTQQNLASAELANAEAQLRISSLQQADQLLTSSIPGMVYSILYEPGELVTTQKPVAILGSPDKLELRLSVDELDIHKIRIGQQIVVSLDAYPDSVYAATVSRIYPMLNSQDLTFRVDAVLAQAMPAAYAGLSVEANIVIQTKTRALVVPKEYLMEGDSLKVELDGKTQYVAVQTGIQNYKLVEILRGVEAGTLILKPE
ncbi:MAG: HlyD family efflux transporter periplasmic adaptor subunit [Bacteroidetes bacterium]|nr:HlyD family efflux transporter periplasmic adaptor subunit [Bacteroidota bacterium]